MSSTGVLSSETELQAILSRAVTVANGYHSPYADDDLRLLRKLGARFLGRSAYQWSTKPDDDAHFTKAQLWAERVHREVGSEVVCQAAVFEVVYPEVELIRVPSWVFEDLGEPVEERTFSFSAMQGRVRIPSQGIGGSPFAGGAVPDLTRREAFRWFYYRAKRYLEAGYEALHIGQVHLIGGSDRGYVVVEELIQKIREAATRSARRGWVILDAHSHGICRNGRLLFDFTSRPLSSRGIPGSPEDVALVRRGDALGGIHPGGWTCRESPVLVEIDNWLGYSMRPSDPAWENPWLRSQAGKWGWDDISWFARQDRAYRHGFLRYAHRWCQLQGENWFFQPAVTRSLGEANMEKPDGSRIHRYRLNDPGPACPDGFGDEDALREIWEEPVLSKPRSEVGKPEHPEELAIPEPVSLVGPLQEWFGGTPGDASCPRSRLHHEGASRFEATFVLPRPGVFAFAVTSGGTMIDPTKQGGVAGGEPFQLTVSEPGQVIRFSFDYLDRTVAATDVLTGRDCLSMG